MPLTNYEKQKRWREKNRALYNLQQRQRRKNLSESGKQPCKHGLEGAKDGLNNVIVQPDNAPPAQTFKDETLERLKGLVKIEQEKPHVEAPVPVKRIYKSETGMVITKEQWEQREEEKNKARMKGFEIDEYSQA